MDLILLTREVEDLVNVISVARRVLAEFKEMPCMTLTPREASRLFGLSDEDCQAVIDVLVNSECLRQTGSGKLVLGGGAAGDIAA